MLEIKKGDVVIIPSENSHKIEIGCFTDNILSEKSGIAAINGLIYCRNTVWLKEIKRSRMDPCLFPLFQAHQAINDISQYSGYIERNIVNGFTQDGISHLVLNVEADNIISKDLFGLGYEITKIIDKVSANYNLGFSSENMEVAINLNSPGNIDFKSGIKKVTTLAILIIMFCGGKYQNGNTILESPGIARTIQTVVTAIESLQESKENREFREEVFAKYKDSLKIQDFHDWVETDEHLRERNAPSNN